MRISDLTWIAIKNFKFRSMVLSVLATAISVFCLCFAGAVLVTVQQEKALPYELEVASMSSGISDEALAEVSGIPDVTAVTPVLQVPVSIHAGQYEADIALTGIDAAYIQYAFVQGGVYSDSSVMPYIVLNKAACKLFTDGASHSESTDETDEPQIDWINAAITVRTSESAKPVISKIVGVLSGDDEEQSPVAYVSIASAKDLLRKEGQSIDYMSATVRIKNAGCSAAVSEQIAALELSVINDNKDAEMRWDMALNEMTYLIVTGTFVLLFSAFLAAARRKTGLSVYKETFTALQWIGMKKRDIAKLFAVQSSINLLLGISLGIIVGVSVPSFLSPEILDTSIFALPIPMGVALISAAVCIVSGLIPFCRLKHNTI